MINDWQARQWSKFFCLSVYVTMYLNDHQRDAFYSSLGMNTTQFNQHVIIETNNTTARIFPEVCTLICCTDMLRLSVWYCLMFEVVMAGVAVGGIYVCSSWSLSMQVQATHTVMLFWLNALDTIFT